MCPIKRDGIAVRQLRALREHQGPRDKKPRLSDVKEMFLEMKKISREIGGSMGIRRAERCFKFGEHQIETARR